MRIIVLLIAISILVNVFLPIVLSQFTQFPMIAVVTMCQRDHGLVPCKFGFSLSLTSANSYLPGLTRIKLAKILFKLFLSSMGFAF